MKTDADEQLLQACRTKVQTLVTDINKTSQEATQRGLLDKEKYVIPPHLHDLQEADLPETQRGLVMTEIAQFRERSAKREREKMRDLKQGVSAARKGGGQGATVLRQARRVCQG